MTAKVVSANGCKVVIGRELARQSVEQSGAIPLDGASSIVSAGCGRLTAERSEGAEPYLDAIAVRRMHVVAHADVGSSFLTLSGLIWADRPNLEILGESLAERREPNRCGRSRFHQIGLVRMEHHGEGSSRRPGRSIAPFGVTGKTQSRLGLLGAEQASGVNKRWQGERAELGTDNRSWR